MSVTDASPDPPEATEAPAEVRPIDLTVTIHSIDGLVFQTEVGTQQVCASILFPSHTVESMSPLTPPAQKVSFEFQEKYSLTVFPHTTVNGLLAHPFEFFLYVCTPDMKKQAKVARFEFPCDPLMFNQTYACALDGTVLHEGSAALPSEGLKMNIELSWSEALFPPEDAEESMIATVSVGGVVSLPLAMIHCSTQPNNAVTHVFSYKLAAELPDSQCLLCDDGNFTTTAADGADAEIQFNTVRKYFVTPAETAKWKEASENGGDIKFLLRPELNALVQPLGIPSEEFSAMFGVAALPLEYFAKPGRSVYQGGIQLARDMEYAERQITEEVTEPNGFPPEPSLDTGKKKQQKKGGSSGRQIASPAKGKAAPAKKGKALSAKDKKAVAQLQSAMQFDPEKDYFKESTTQLKVEIALSKPLIPRPPTPASTKTPEQIVKPLPKMHEVRLANATEEFCRQVTVAVEKLQKAQVSGTKMDALKKLIKEELKPSIVDIVKQVYASEDGKQEKKVTEAFIAELRSFLMANLNKTINAKFDLAYPRRPPVPPEMDVEHITQRIQEQGYHHTNDLEALYLKRCELEPLNAKWPFDLALYYNDKGSPKAAEQFAKAVSIDYSFTAAILGFCAHLAKSGNREDCIVLLNMLNERTKDDPTVTVCLSILYELIESSKADQFRAKVSQMASRLPESPNITAAESLLQVHDTYLSEIMLAREQVAGQRTKKLLVLMAQLSQLTGNTSRAQEYIKEAIDLDREDLELWKTLGSYQYDAGEKEKAFASFEQLLALSEHPDPEICLKLAMLHLIHGNHSKAYDLLLSTVQQRELAIAWTALGVCCLRMGELDEAEVSLCRGNELDKWDATTWGYCAIVCAKLNRRCEGEQAVCWAADLQLRDFRLIQEILEHYAEVESEETRRCISVLRSVTEDQCHEPLESVVSEEEDHPEEEGSV